MFLLTSYSFLSLLWACCPCLNLQGHVLKCSTSPPVIIMEPYGTQGQLPPSPSECLIMDYWRFCGMEAAQNPSILAVWDSLGCQNPLTALVCPGVWCWATHPGCAGWLLMAIPSQPCRKSVFKRICHKVSPGHSAELGFVQMRHSCSALCWMPQLKLTMASLLLWWNILFTSPTPLPALTKGSPPIFMLFCLFEEFSLVLNIYHGDITAARSKGRQMNHMKKYKNLTSTNFII